MSFDFLSQWVTSGRCVLRPRTHDFSRNEKDGRNFISRVLHRFSLTIELYSKANIALSYYVQCCGLLPGLLGLYSIIEDTRLYLIYM